MRLALWLAFLGLVLVRLTVAQSSMSDEPEANPGRPTVSTPATLTPMAYLLFESGFLGASRSPEFSSRYGPNEVTKLSITPRLEVIASAEPYVRYSADGTSPNGTAEVFRGAQAVVVHGEHAKPTIAASYFRLVYVVSDVGLPRRVHEFSGERAFYFKYRFTMSISSSAASACSEAGLCFGSRT